MPVPTSIRLNAEIDARLEMLAQRTGRTKNDLITQAILTQLDGIEDAELAVGRYREHLRSGEPTIPLADVLDDQ